MTLRFEQDHKAVGQRVRWMIGLAAVTMVVLPLITGLIVFRPIVVNTIGRTFGFVMVGLMVAVSAIVVAMVWNTVSALTDARVIFEQDRLLWHSARRRREIRYKDMRQVAVVETAAGVQSLTIYADGARGLQIAGFPEMGAVVEALQGRVGDAVKWVSMTPNQQVVSSTFLVPQLVMFGLMGIWWLLGYSPIRDFQIYTYTMAGVYGAWMLRGFVLRGFGRNLPKSWRLLVRSGEVALGLLLLGLIGYVFLGGRAGVQTSPCGQAATPEMGCVQFIDDASAIFAFMDGERIVFGDRSGVFEQDARREGIRKPALRTISGATDGWRGVLVAGDTVLVDDLGDMAFLDYASGAVRYQADRWVSTPSLSADGTLAAWRDMDGDFYATIDTASGETVAEFDTFNLAFLGSDEVVYSEWRLAHMVVADARTGDVRLKLPFQTIRNVDAVAVSADSQYVAAGDRREINVWHVESGERIVVEPPSTSSDLQKLALNSDGSLLVTALMDNAMEGTLRLLLWRGTELVGQLDLDDKHTSIQHVAFSADDALLGVGTFDGILIFETETLIQSIVQQ